MEKPRSFKDFQRDAEIKSNKLLEDLDPRRAQEKKQAFLDYPESIKYIKETFKEKPYHTYGKKMLTDEQVKYIRANYCSIGLTVLCKQMELTHSCVYNCAKGLTFKRLNLKYRPVH
jgi:hypothetical protein